MEKRTTDINFNNEFALELLGPINKMSLEELEIYLSQISDDMKDQLYYSAMFTGNLGLAEKIKNNGNKKK